MLPGEGLVVCFYLFLGHPLILEGDQLCEHNPRGRLSHSYYAYWGKISSNRCKETSVDHAHHHNSDLPLPKCQLVCAIMT